jgi:hypothetical protein
MWQFLIGNGIVIRQRCCRIAKIGDLGKWCAIRVGVFKGVGQEKEKVGEFVVGVHTVCIRGRFYFVATFVFADYCTEDRRLDSKPLAPRYADLIGYAVNWLRS